MLHALSPSSGKHAISNLGTSLVSWGAAILLVVTGYPILVQLLKLLLMLLYEVMVQYRY